MIEPRLHPVAIIDLRPTQMTLGLREVALKRAAWRGRGDDAAAAYLGRHMIPVVIGPRGRPWLIDHHHLARALHDEGVADVLVSTVARLDHLPKAEFLVHMESRGWLHPFDAGGVRRDAADLPRHIGGLIDDPYRALAAAVLRAGGYAKSATPYAEFLWADFLRRRVKARRLARFDQAVARALALARSADAAHLPGWCGPHDD